MLKNKLIVGTVQFGVNYGINNSTGLLDDQAVINLLDKIRKEIGCLDTAAAYGDAEKRIGMYHQNGDVYDVITKFPKEEVNDFNSYFKEVLAKLKVDKLKAVLFHSFQEYERNKMHLNEFNKKFKGVFFEKIGVSVYTIEEMEKVSLDEEIDIVQAPFNLLDNASKRSEGLEMLKNRNKEVHIRSVFLQGLFFKDVNQIKGNIQRLTPYLKQIHELSKTYQIGIGEMALLYVIQNEFVDKVLIGIDNEDQFYLNLKWINNRVLSKDLLNEINSINVSEEELLMPFNWK